MRKPISVVSIAYDRLWAFEFSMSAFFFSIDWQELGFKPYRFAVASIDGASVRAFGGFDIVVRGRLPLLDRADMIVVPGWRDSDEVPPASLLKALRRADERGARVVSICNGAFVLAHAGLLDGRRATTHWALTGLLKERFPKVIVEPDVLYVEDGNIMTSAGSASGLDMLLSIVRKDYGPRIANMFARRMVIPPHREGGQSQFVLQPVAIRTSDKISSVLDWMARHSGTAICVEDLATRAALSTRSFNRRFRAATGTSPIEWLTRLRIRQAQDLLESTREPIERVAEVAGFGTPETLRHHFRRVVGTSPAAWRRTFGFAAGNMSAPRAERR
jgi:AraC family transcriptional regulator, transcriptional activator FtrA